MATSEIIELRGLADLADDEYTDIELQQLITDKGSVEAAARRLWQIKAAASASLMDRSESGSSMSMSQLHKQALTMADSFKDPAEEAEALAPRKMSRRAVRR